MKLSRQNKIVVGIVALVLALTVGYALFSQSLNIGGTASADGTFELVFDSIGTIVEKGSTGAEATNSQDKKTLTITVPNLEYPGAYVQVPVVIKNTGTVDAKLLGITTEGLSNDDMEVTYTGLEQNDIIKSEATRDIVITIKWKESSVTTSSSLSFNIGLNYEQVRVEDITTGSSESSFPVVEGQLGDNVYFKYDNGVIEITGSGDMWDGKVGDTNSCSIAYDSSHCYLGAEIAEKMSKEFTLKNEVARNFLQLGLQTFLLGNSYEFIGTTKDECEQFLMESEENDGAGLSELEADEILLILDSVPKLKKIIIDEGITSIRYDFFSNMVIDEITIPNSVTKLNGDNNTYKLFRYCSIGIVNLGTGLSTLKERMISDSSVNEIVIPEGVTTIETLAISVKNLTALTIPQSVTTIEKYALRDNDDLITIINKTKRAFDWGGILTNTSSTEKVTDIVEYNGRTITITE